MNFILVHHLSTVAMYFRFLHKFIHTISMVCGSMPSCLLTVHIVVSTKVYMYM